MPRPRKESRIGRGAYLWQDLYCQQCGTINLHRQKDGYTGRRDTLFCKTYTYQCVCGKYRNAGIDIDKAMKPLRVGIAYALAEA